MPTITDLLTNVERERRDAVRRRDDALAASQDLIDQVIASGRDRLTADEDKRAAALTKDRRAAIDALDAIDDKLNECKRLALEQAENDAAARDTKPTGVRRPTSYDGVARVGAEPRTYNRDDDRDGKPTFLKDLYASQVKRDPAAGERLARHGREIEVDNPGYAKRAVNTGAVSGFVPPQYMVELWAELARAGRPISNLCTRLPLPEIGMTVNVPRVTTGTTVAAQASENATVSNTDLDDTLLTVNVNTYAGYVDVSRQAIERGVIVEPLILGDLASDYNAKLDAAVVNGAGTSGTHLGILNVGSITTITYTDATPTVPELWPKMADMARQVVSQRFTGPTAICMTPLCWGWMLSVVDTTGRPLVDLLGTGNNAAAVGGQPMYEGAAGRMFGVPVYLSGGIPANLGAGTNETRIIAADFRDLVLLEDESNAPAQLRFDEPLSNSLGVRLLAYGYSAAALGRQPKAISVVSGTGLILPSL
jgi:HK97 family phage major capsid protein